VFVVWQQYGNCQHHYENSRSPADNRGFGLPDQQLVPLERVVGAQVSESRMSRASRSLGWNRKREIGGCYRTGRILRAAWSTLVLKTTQPSRFVFVDERSLSTPRLRPAITTTRWARISACRLQLSSRSLRVSDLSGDATCNQDLRYFYEIHRRFIADSYHAACTSEEWRNF
jgi:hypothetical protein